jgi:hypothetical protein
MDSKKDYGVKLSGYSLSSSKSGTKLSSYYRSSDKEYQLGKVKSEETFKDGSFTVTVWTLTHGPKYYYVS